MLGVPENYPNELSEQEQQLMDQISARRKKYMEQYGAAESFYINADKASRRYTAPTEGNSEEEISTNLFR